MRWILKLEYQDLIKRFESKNYITLDELFRYYKSNEPNIKRNTVYWRTHQLVKNNIIKRISKGKYQIHPIKNFSPPIFKQERQISLLLQKELPFVSYCIWQSSIINYFSRHILPQAFTIVEIEKDALDAAFELIKSKFPITYKNPTSEIMEHYILNRPDAIVVKKLVSEAPVRLIQEIPTISLEKFLVDIYCDKQIFYFLQGEELYFIYKAAFDNYTINVNRLLRYASRRKKKEQISKMIMLINK